MASSPLIQNGDLVLTDSGLLQSAPDIQTQMTVTVSAYNCIYNSNVNSNLLPSLTGIPRGGWNSSAIANTVVAAYTPIMLVQRIISDLNVSVSFPSLSYVTIKISAIDSEGNPITLSWTNTQWG